VELGFSPEAAKRGDPGRMKQALKGHLAHAASYPYEVIAEGGDAEPKVSVVVPTHNRRDLLEETIRALFRQDLDPQLYEVIVVDNASSDGTTAMLERLVEEAPTRLLALRLTEDRGPAAGRNVGLIHARGEQVAFTDSDCLPSAGWLGACLEKMTPEVGVVQGQTLPDPSKGQPFFNHFIETRRLDGSFSTSNVCYRRGAICAAGGFDPRCDYWEDTDLGWRVRRDGWMMTFNEEAIVYHQVLPLSPSEWVRWPLRFRTMPAKAARYPEFRSFLFLRLWVDWYHALFSLALVAIPFGVFIHYGLFFLAMPYLVAIPVRHELKGRWPPVKAVFHLVWDLVSLYALLVSSVRHRALVL
jgi:glycosyltransferase involved in cell wall biosynthesis